MENTKSKELSEKLKSAMPLINTPYKLGHGMDAVMDIVDEDLKNVALGEYYHFTGDSAKAADIVENYMYHSDIAVNLSACWVYLFANIALNQEKKACFAMEKIQCTLEACNDEIPLSYKALSVCASNASAVMLHLPLPKIIEPIKKYLHMMPPGLKLFMLYIEAHHSYLNKQYGACIGIAETALVLEGELYPIASIYLHLIAAIGYINLRHTKEAKEHLLEAWEIAQPDHMVTIFGEHQGLLCGMLEAIIKKEYPDDFKYIIDIAGRYSAGWRKVHNKETGNKVPDQLTTTEFVVAMLAARDWTNKEISVHLGISTNTVKMHITSALQKLGIAKRKEFAQFMIG